MEVDEKTKKKIESLEFELYLTRQTIIDLMSDEKQHILNSYYQCKTREEIYLWKNRIAKELIALIKPLPIEYRSPFSKRALCPLCGQGTSSANEFGYKIPEGLRRHLVGWNSNSQCSVTKAAFKLALDYWKEKFPRNEQYKKSE